MRKAKRGFWDRLRVYGLANQIAHHLSDKDEDYMSSFLKGATTRWEWEYDKVADMLTFRRMQKQEALVETVTSSTGIAVVSVTPQPPVCKWSALVFPVELLDTRSNDGKRLWPAIVNAAYYRM